MGIDMAESHQAQDPIVEAVRAKLLARSQAGIAKYGTDLTRTDLTQLEWLRHWQEELLDAANYAEVLIQMEERREDQRAREQELLSRVYSNLE